MSLPLFAGARTALTALVFLLATLGAASAASLANLKHCAGNESTQYNEIQVCGSDCRTIKPTHDDYDQGVWLNYLPGAFLTLMTDKDAATDWVSSAEFKVAGKTCTIPARVVVMTSYFKDKAKGTYAKYVDARCGFFGVDPQSDVYDNNVSSAAYLSYSNPDAAFSYQYSDCPYFVDSVVRGHAKSSVENAPTAFDPDSVTDLIDGRSADDVDPATYEGVGPVSIETFDPMTLALQR